MNPFSRLLRLSVLVIASLPALRADEAAPPVVESAPAAAWLTDYERALERARDEKKPVLLDFTGSDWCVWCHRLRDQILTQKPFLDHAREHLVLVELDYPHNTPQSPKLQRQNAALAEKFGVTGYPTLVLVDAEGRELGRTGYMQGGPKTFVRELKRFAARTPAGGSPPAAK
jgi:thioredoxin-related protein